LGGGSEEIHSRVKVLALHGRTAETFRRDGANDIVVTSYALLRRDAERYRELEFDVVVLDERSTSKNGKLRMRRR